MNNRERIEQMQARLESTLNPESLTITDDSHKHVGHAGAKTGMGHFTIDIQAKALEGKSRIEQHKLIYQALGDMMDTEIHALAIRVANK